MYMWLCSTSISSLVTERSEVACYNSREPREPREITFTSNFASLSYLLAQSGACLFYFNNNLSVDLICQ